MCCKFQGELKLNGGVLRDATSIGLGTYKFCLPKRIENIHDCIRIHTMNLVTSEHIIIKYGLARKLGEGQILKAPN